LGYKRELVYVVHEEVAGMTGVNVPRIETRLATTAESKWEHIIDVLGSPAAAWLSPRQEVNSLGA
jgi:hypothetical protein